MNLLDRDAILGAQDLPTEDVSVPEWGGTVRVRGLTGSERDAWEASLVQGAGTKHARLVLADVRARLLARTIVDEEGKHIFGDGDIKALSAKSAMALERVFKVAQRLSGLTDEDVEELAGNSDSAPSDASGTA